MKFKKLFYFFAAAAQNQFWLHSNAIWLYASTLVRLHKKKSKIAARKNKQSTTAVQLFIYIKFARMKCSNRQQIWNLINSVAAARERERKGWEMSVCSSGQGGSHARPSLNSSSSVVCHPLAIKRKKKQIL